MLRTVAHRETVFPWLSPRSAWRQSKRVAAMRAGAAENVVWSAASSVATATRAQGEESCQATIRL